MNKNITKTQKSRSGYVYVMTNPVLPGWIKIGRTFRPPYKRARELSKTSLPEDFEVRFAHFFWDNVIAEREIHKKLRHLLSEKNCRKEFFKIGINQGVQEIINIKKNFDIYYQKEYQQKLNIVKEKSDSKILSSINFKNTINSNYQDDHFIESIDDLELRWDLAYEKINSGNKNLINKGWREMERLSAEGWADGTCRFAEEMMKHAKNKQHFAKVTWIWKAAEKQGAEYAGFRGSWCYSMLNTPESLAVWHNALDQLNNSKFFNLSYSNKEQILPFYIMETLKNEIEYWKLNGQRLSCHPIWEKFTNMYDTKNFKSLDTL